MKILLTGATGFLGSHLLKNFTDNNYEVIALKRSTSNLWRIKNIKTHVTYYDVDKIKLEQIFQKNLNIDAIVHTATCYGRKSEAVLQIEKVNVLFPLEIIELAIKYNCRYFYNTDTLLKNDLNYYSISKKQFVDWGKKFADEQKIHFYNLKLEHMYGELDDDAKFIPYLIEQCRLNVPKINLTTGEQKRDFIYVEDIVDIYDFLLKNEKLKKCQYEKIEIGTGKSVRVREVVSQIHLMTKSKSFLNFGEIPYRKGECMNVKVNLSKLKKLGFQTEQMIDFKEGLDRIYSRNT
ncbi:MAG: NAD-dependent epimerase/dehydratase [Eubacterium sp.]